MKSGRRSFTVCGFVWATLVLVQSLPAQENTSNLWNQWRGPLRNGEVQGKDWPASIAESHLTSRWRVDLDPSYSGPIVSESMVYVTGTANQKSEVVLGLDRQTGKELWRAEWEGAMTVPFFAAANGSWIRATPVLDGDSIYVAGMKDVLVSLNAKTGKEQWRVDFTKEFGSAVPSFGFVSSPLVDGAALFVQAGASFCKLEKATGKVIWRVLKDDGGMMGGAFASPVFSTLAGERQLLVQTREKLVGVNPETGASLWEKTIPNFRGMNILTPITFGDAVFTSSYQNKSWMFGVAKNDSGYQVGESWNNNAQAYMSTPVVIDGHAYMHLQNQRFTCINLKTGERTWTSQPFGKYCSLVFQKDRILALDQRGKLLLIKANPKAFELIEERKVSDEETWAHLAVVGEEVFVRELKAMSVFQWKNP